MDCLFHPSYIFLIFKLKSKFSWHSTRCYGPCNTFNSSYWNNTASIHFDYQTSLENIKSIVFNQLFIISCLTGFPQMYLQSEILFETFLSRETSNMRDCNSCITHWLASSPCPAAGFTTVFATSTTITRILSLLLGTTVPSVFFKIRAVGAITLKCA